VLGVGEGEKEFVGGKQLKELFVKSPSTGAICSLLLQISRKIDMDDASSASSPSTLHKKSHHGRTFISVTHASSPAQSLYADVLGCIFSALNIKEHMVVAVVCRSWYAAIQRSSTYKALCFMSTMHTSDLLLLQPMITRHQHMTLANERLAVARVQLDSDLPIMGCLAVAEPLRVTIKSARVLAVSSLNEVILQLSFPSKSDLTFHIDMLGGIRLGAFERVYPECGYGRTYYHVQAITRILHSSGILIGTRQQNSLLLLAFVRALSSLQLHLYKPSLNDPNWPKAV
jgi:hypothetical protein